MFVQWQQSYVRKYLLYQMTKNAIHLFSILANESPGGTIRVYVS